MADVLLAKRKEMALESNVKYFGVHHLALNTDDMKTTVDFYVGVLEMRLVHAMKVPAGTRHRPRQSRQSPVRGNPPLFL